MVDFVEEDVRFPSFFDAEKTSSWLNKLASAHGAAIRGLTFIFCSDEYLLTINKKYLNHDYYTDIITFPYRQGKLLESDIFISLERVEDNSKQQEVSFENELIRVMAHGVLHLLGFKDKETNQETQMRLEEEKALHLFFHIQE